MRQFTKRKGAGSRSFSSFESLKSVIVSLKPSILGRVQRRLGQEVNILNSKRIETFKTIFSQYSGFLAPQRQFPREFTPKVPIHFTKGDFTVKTTDTREEFEEVIKLR